MATITDRGAARSSALAAWLIAAAALLLVLLLHLLPALLAGLMVYELVHLLAPRLPLSRIRSGQAKLFAVALLALVVVLLLTAAILGIAAFVRSDAGSLPALLQKMADILDKWRTTLPAAIVEHLPADVDDLEGTAVGWLRGHAGTLQHVGAEAGRALAHVVIGAGIGALVSLDDVKSPHRLGPLGQALQDRTARLGDAFRRVVFGQVQISAINALLTAVYLAVALPIAGVHVPLAGTMIAMTFVAGLLPVVGNLVSNTAIVILSLSVSPGVAVTSLVFLVVIHKLEYFLNAMIVGTQVRAHAWELLLAMLVLEAAFGIPGLVAAPIYYAYVKDELVNQKLV